MTTKIETHKGASRTINDIVNQEKHERGRPSRGEQANIEKKLRPYYEKYIYAVLKDTKNGFNIKTLFNYFNKWHKEIMESEKQDFIQRCKQQKEQCILAYDEQIFSLNEDKDELGRLIQSSKRSGNLSLMERLFNLKLKTTEKIGSFVAAKINLVNVPIADTIIDLEKKKSNRKEGEKNGSNQSK